MKKIELGQTIAILANVGVIAGILFLAIELRQNNEALGLQSRLERENALITAFTRDLDNPIMLRAEA